MIRNARYLLVAFFTGLAASVYGVYFFRADHFFQGDTIFWFYHRLHSFPEFIRSFASPDPGGWYRPLTNRTVQSALYSALGFHTTGYRFVLYVLFVADIAAVWALVQRFTRKPPAAAIGATFFAFHTVNAYTTYDLSFVPELVYTLFYLSAVIAFLRYLDSGAGFWKFTSFGCFVLSLCSKESAVTLPATLLIVALFGGFAFRKVLVDLIPFGVLLIAYLWFTVIHLGVASEALASLHTPPAQLETGGYYFMVGPHILTNAATAWAWALNLPVGLLGQWRDVTRMRSIVLWGFAAIQMLLIIYYCAVRRNRLPIFTAASLFWITALPALPLMGHFLPYYMFLPIGAFAALVGATWQQFYEDLAKRTPAGAGLVLILIFVVLGVVCVKSARSEARNNFLLGSSSRLAEASLADFRAISAKIPRPAVIFIDDDAKPDLAFHHAGGALFKLAFDDDSLQFRYSSLKESSSGATIKLIFRDGHLQEDKY